MAWEIRRSDGVVQGDNAGPLLLFYTDEKETRLIATERNFLRIFLAEAALKKEEFTLFLSLFTDRGEGSRDIYADWLEEHERPLGAMMLRQNWSRGWENA